MMVALSKMPEREEEKEKDEESRASMGWCSALYC
jgi:hypothetical protein